MHLSALIILLCTTAAAVAATADAADSDRPSMLRNLQSAYSERDNLSKGKEAAEKLLKFIRSNEFNKVLDLVGTFGGPIAGTVTSILKIVIGSSSEDSDRQFARQAFAEINNKLEALTQEFHEVKSLIDWNAIQVSYGTYERSVRALKAQLQLLVDAPQGSISNLREMFVKKFESDFQNAALKIYDGIANSDLIFSRNLLEASAKFTQNHRRKVQMFSMGLTQLLLQAIEVQMAYFDLKYDNQDTSDYIKTVWNQRMLTLKSKMSSFDDVITSRWREQMPLDAARILRENQQLPNNELTLKLYYFMNEKFYWRAFASIVYNDVVGESYHDMSFCHGFTSFGKFGKNVVVSSVDKSLSNFNRTKVEEIKAALEGATKKDADHLLEIINGADNDTAQNCDQLKLKFVAIQSSEVKLAALISHSSRLKVCVSSFWGTTCFSVVLFG